MITHLLCLPPRLQEKVTAALAVVPRKAHFTSLLKWCKLLGLLSRLLVLLFIITPAVSGLRGMFTWVQHAVKRATGRHSQLTADVHNELEHWRKLVRILASQPTHLQKLQSFPPHELGLLMHQCLEWEGYAKI